MSKSSTYTRKLLACQTDVTCALCDEKMTPAKLVKHFKTVHNQKYACVWCGGQKYWKRGETNRYYPHILECFDKHVMNQAVDEYNQLKDHIKKCKIETCCPVCKKTFLVCQLEIHVRKVHSFKNKCVWCDGQYQWKPKCKKYQISHLKTCFENFFANLNPINESFELLEEEEEEPFELLDEPFNLSEEELCKPIVQKVLSHWTPIVREKYYFTNMGHKSWMAIEFCQHSMDSSIPILFRENLGEAEYYVKLFQQQCNNLQWYHIMVRDTAFLAFKTQLEEFSQATLCPFWCLCDDGYRHHRHMILITKDKHFLNDCWRKLKDDETYSKKAIRIKNEVHLINTIHFVSQTQSKCQFKGTGGHYYINKNLPKCVKLCLFLVAGDYFALLNQEHKARTMIPCVEKKNNQWCVKVSNLVGKDLCIVLPVLKHLKPIGIEKSPKKFHLKLGPNRYLNFEPKDLSNLSFQDWIEVQRAGGNNFYDVVGEDWWPLARTQQKIENAVEYKLKPITEEMVRLQELNQKINEENARLRVEMDRFKQL